MNDKEIYKQKFQAQLDGWQADIDKLKAKALTSKSDIQLEINKLTDELEASTKSAKEKLSELTEASGDALASVKSGVESAWDSLKKSVHDAVSKFKD